MTNGERLAAFFEAENRRDWEAYRAFLHPDVTWVLHGAQVETIYGIDAYLLRMRSAYRDNTDTFRCEKQYESADGRRIVAMLVNSRGEASCDVFEFCDQLILREDEFLL